MTEITTTAGNIFYRAPRSTVYVADALREADFVEVPHLKCTMLHDCVAPEIGRAQLEYEYGTILREDGAGFEPFDILNIVGRFVKIEIVDTVLNEDEEPAASIVWYGVVENDAKDVFGTRDDVPTGVQFLTAFGVLRIAERTPIRESVVEDPAGGDAITINHALPFNQDSGGIFVRRGNRSTSEDDQSYIFSPEQRSLSIWDAYEAVRYLLKKFSPLSSSGTPANQWLFHESVQPSWLDWYDIAVECDGQTLKSCLDALIDRRRGVGYYAAFNPETDQIEIHVFSFVDANISLPSGKTLTTNPDQYSLDFENALDVDAHVSTVGVTQYHQVIARGALRTTTFTERLIDLPGSIGLSVSPWIRDWDDDEQSEFLDGASGEAGYGDLSTEEKQRANAMWRTSDRLRNVFTRWKLNPKWNKHVNDITGVVATNWLFCPVIPDDPENGPVENATDGEAEPFWTGGVRVLRGLPFLDRYDYSGTKIFDVSYGAAFTQLEQPDFVPPMAFLKTEKPNSDPVEYEYELLDKINITSATAAEQRRWAASFHLTDTGPAVELRAHPAQMLGRKEWEDGTPAATADEHDPEVSFGCDWRNIAITACLEIPEHVEQMEEIGEPPVLDAPLAKLIINVPDARFDWVVPYTVVELKNGKAIQSTSGGAIRDDRKRLASIARCAAEWYGRNRQTLDLQYKQVRGLFGLGWLITSVGANYSLTDINTVITSITYVLDSQTSVPTTTIKTSFAELDVL